MKYEFREVNGRKLMVIKQSDPEKPTPAPKPMCAPRHVGAVASKITKRLKADPEGPLAGYHKAVLAEFEADRIPVVI